MTKNCVDHISEPIVAAEVEAHRHSRTSINSINVDVRFGDSRDVSFTESISAMIERASKVKGAGIALRTPEYLRTKILEGKAIIAIATDKDGAERAVGFCYIEAWEDKQYVANSGLIVDPEFRGSGLATLIKERAFELSRLRFPDAKLFGLTTNPAVVKINTKLGYVPVAFEELTSDDEFWDGCKSCSYHDILMRMERKICLCTGMLYDPVRIGKQGDKDK